MYLCVTYILSILAVFSQLQNILKLHSSTKALQGLCEHMILSVTLEERLIYQVNANKVL